VAIASTLKLRRQVADECSAGSESVLRREAPHGDVERVIGEQKLGATADLFQAKAGATVLEAHALAAKIGAKLAFLSGKDAGESKPDDENDLSHVAFFTLAP